MGMGVFDQASRSAIKGAPGFFRWLSPAFVERFRFERWVDTRTLAFPGEPDRICDTVAEFVPIDGIGPRRLLDVEPQSEPDSEMLDRTGEYAFRLRRELRYGANARDKYHVIPVVLNLTGPEQPREIDMREADLDGAGIYERLFQVTMRDRDAAATLAAIAAEPRLVGVLPWVPLMRRGDEPDIIEEWIRLATQEPDDRRRSQYATLARTFAELAGRMPVWQQALEGWNVKTSVQVLEWQAERDRMRLFQLIETRFHVPVPEDLAATINGLVDPNQLTQWFNAGYTTDSLEAFRAAVGQLGSQETNGAA
jgi:hypothetical protein